jgi:hypothetical protein
MDPESTTFSQRQYLVSMRIKQKIYDVEKGRDIGKDRQSRCEAVATLEPEPT